MLRMIFCGQAQLQPISKNNYYLLNLGSIVYKFKNPSLFKESPLWFTFLDPFPYRYIASINKSAG